MMNRQDQKRRRNYFDSLLLSGMISTDEIILLIGFVLGFDSALGSLETVCRSCFFSQIASAFIQCSQSWPSWQLYCSQIL